MDRDCSGGLGLTLRHDEELSGDTIPGPIAAPYEPTHRDPLNIPPYYKRRSLSALLSTPIAVSSATSSAASFTRSPAFLPREKARRRESTWEGPQEGEGGGAPGSGWGEGWKRGKRVDRRVGTKEAHNSPRCFLVAWLSRDRREKERGGGEENALVIGPAGRDHSPTRYSILHDPMAPRNST